MAKTTGTDIEEMLSGRGSAPSAPRELRAGPLSLELDGVDIRRAQAHGVEVLQQLYFAVRDEAWNTLPGEIDDMSVDVGPGNRFEARYTSRHRFAELGLDLSCRARISGTETGELSYDVDVEAHSSFVYNRIGLNLLHGVRTYAGRPYQTWLQGQEVAGSLPASVGPVPFVDGRLAGLLPPFDHLRLSPIEGVEVDIRLEGDEFETEDQRNYGDSAFKTYSTPLQHPGPFRLERGQHLQQRATVSVRDERGPGAARTEAPGDRPLTIRLGSTSGQQVSAIGLGAVDDGPALTREEAQRAAALRPDHLRVELDLAAGVSACRARYETTAEQARAIGCDVWVDLITAADEANADPVTLVHALGRTEPAPRVLHLATPLTEPPDQGRSRQLLDGVRAAIREAGLDTMVGSGAYLFFADVNREPFDGAVVERLTYATSPTGHRIDDATVVENLDRQGSLVATVREQLGQRPLSVGPITLAYRHGPFPAGPSAAGDLPPRVDLRQTSLLGAAITAGYVAELSAAGADALTFYEAAGWLGVAERDAGAPSDRFPSRPGTVFPLWHVLADAAEWRGADVLSFEIEPAPVFTAPVAVLGTSDTAGVHLLLASLRREEQRVTVAGLEATEARVRPLDLSTFETARDEPERFRSGGVARTVERGCLDLELPAYAVLRIDFV